MNKRSRSSGGRRRLTKQRRIRQRNRAILCLVLGIAALISVSVFTVRLVSRARSAEQKAVESTVSDERWEGAPPLDVQLLTVNEYSRPGIPLEKINGIVVHYTANPGSSAQANRNYFEGLKDEHTTKVSSHFVIGLEGEIIQCIPSTEIAYASNERNGDTLSIECCHPDETGAFTEETYRSLVELTGWLCHRFDLTAEQVIRHYDVTGKDCPKYFVEHEEDWEKFREEVEAVRSGL